MWKTVGSEELRTGSAGRNRGARAPQVSWVVRWCEFDGAKLEWHFVAIRCQAVVWGEKGLHRLAAGGYGGRWLRRQVATARGGYGERWLRREVATATGGPVGLIGFDWYRLVLSELAKDLDPSIEHRIASGKRDTEMGIPP
jgi:hypothetical protein